MRAEVSLLPNMSEFTSARAERHFCLQTLLFIHIRNDRQCIALSQAEKFHLMIIKWILLGRIVVKAMRSLHMQCSDVIIEVNKLMT